jgi:hypothetical protein
MSLRTLASADPELLELLDALLEKAAAEKPDDVKRFCFKFFKDAVAISSTSDARGVLTPLDTSRKGRAEQCSCS